MIYINLWKIFMAKRLSEEIKDNIVRLYLGGFSTMQSLALSDTSIKIIMSLKFLE